MAAKRNPAADNGEAPSFEVALERLETIVEELEGGNLTLDESIKRYEEGVKLSRLLGQTLDQAEKRIERLVAAADGPASTEPMELGEDEVAPPPPATPAPGAPRSAAPPAVPRSRDERGPGELPF